MALLFVMAGPASPASVTRHDAKVRTFKALLRETEKPADASDATNAAITVAGCRRVGSGFLCRGSLSPVAFSGIDGATCRFAVAVYPHSTRVKVGVCE